MLQTCICVWNCSPRALCFAFDRLNAEVNNLFAGDVPLEMMSASTSCLFLNLTFPRQGTT